MSGFVTPFVDVSSLEHDARVMRARAAPAVKRKFFICLKWFSE
jgi:hypothetical protein